MFSRINRIKQIKIITGKSYDLIRKSTATYTTPLPIEPLYINYFITRKCNYKCGFCFHTAKTESYLPLNEAKQGLELLAEYGMRKINFAGGEPFIIDKGKYLGELLRFCKQDIKIPIVSVVSNGSVISRKWMDKYSSFVDMLAISIDSFNQETNKKIGRYLIGTTVTQKDITYNVSDLCHVFGVNFKINSVINKYNYQEIMDDHIIRLDPMRWKIFKCLLIDGENVNGLRNASDFTISNDEFQYFVDRHKHVPNCIVEDNDTMRNSYYLLDEKLRFLNCANGKKEETDSILDVGVEEALQSVLFDKEAFKNRDGDLEISAGSLQNLQ